MVTENELLESLLKQADELPHRDEAALDSLLRRTEMLIRRIFGESSPYLKSLEPVYFRPLFAPADESYKDERWCSGHQSIINLVRTMLEEQRVFRSALVPGLTIHDEELRRRTSDLLSAPGSYDRILREATTILEDRIRRRVPCDDLAQLIPNASDQTGDHLINKLFSPSEPVIVCGSRAEQNRLFRMLGGVIAYLRNPSHHAVDDGVKWSWAWSVAGLVDQLLDDVDSATYRRPTRLQT